MSFDKDDQMERDGSYEHLTCHICPARFRDDNHMAEHLGRHRKIARGDGSENDRLTNQRQASRAQVGDLQEMLEELRSG